MWQNAIRWAVSFCCDANKLSSAWSTHNSKTGVYCCCCCGCVTVTVWQCHWVFALSLWQRQGGIVRFFYSGAHSLKILLQGPQNAGAMWVKGRNNNIVLSFSILNLDPKTPLPQTALSIIVNSDICRQTVKLNTPIIWPINWWKSSFFNKSGRLVKSLLYCDLLLFFLSFFFFFPRSWSLHKIFTSRKLEWKKRNNKDTVFSFLFDPHKMKAKWSFPQTLHFFCTSFCLLLTVSAVFLLITKHSQSEMTFLP